MGVCVQQPPPEHAIDFNTRENLDDYVTYGDKERAAVAVTTYTAYNRARCQGQPALASCFDSEANVVYGLLSHNHLLLVLLCWLGGATWELNDEERVWLEKVLDKEGRLDLAAAVAAENLVESDNSMRTAGQTPIP